MYNMVKSLTPKQKFYFFIFFVVRLYNYSMYSFYKFFGINYKKKRETVTTLSDKYIEKYKNNFLETYNKLQINFNENIAPCFYDKDELSKVLTDENNELEKEWRTRILFENTSRGNIIMHYNPYKYGFAYYCDQGGLPYNILNAVAMKYVTLFRCRDFFVDNKETPEDKQSPLLPVIDGELYELIQKEKNRGTLEFAKEENVNTNKKSAFVKFKSYNTASDKLTKKSIPELALPAIKQNAKIPVSIKMPQIKLDLKKEEDDGICIRNKFMYSGKMANYSLLQIAPKPKSIVFKSQLLDALRNESDNLQTQVMSYSDFKKMKNANKTDEIVKNI